MNKQQHIIFALLGLIVGGLIILGCRSIVHQVVLNNQIKQANQELDLILKNRVEQPEVDKNDPWGTPYVLRLESKEEDVFKKYVVMCAGPDRKMGTADDIVKNNHDMNWTNAGSAVGVRTGRFAKGFWTGLWQSGDGN